MERHQDITEETAEYLEEMWFEMFFNTVQVCDEAPGGSGFLRGGHPEQWAGCSGDHGEQTQQRKTETHERAEHPEAGWC